MKLKIHDIKKNRNDLALLFSIKLFWMDELPFFIANDKYSQTPNFYKQGCNRRASLEISEEVREPRSMCTREENQSFVCPSIWKLLEIDTTP